MPEKKPALNHPVIHPDGTLELDPATAAEFAELDAVVAEEQAIETGQLTKAQRTALLLYPGDTEADRRAREIIVSAPQEPPARPEAYWKAHAAGYDAAAASGDPRDTKLHDAAAKAYLQANGEEWEDAWLQGWWSFIDGKPREAPVPSGATPLGKITAAAARAYLEDAGLEWVLTPAREVGKTTANMTTNPVSVETMRLVAEATDEALKVPDSPAAQGWRFWVGLLQDVQTHLGERGTELLIAQPSKALPPILRGVRLLEHVSSSQAAQMVAEIDATEFTGSTEPYPEYADLEQALVGHLTAIYEAGWYAVSALLADGELRPVQREGLTPMLVVA